MFRTFPCADRVVGCTERIGTQRQRSSVVSSAKLSLSFKGFLLTAPVPYRNATTTPAGSRQRSIDDVIASGGGETTVDTRDAASSLEGTQSAQATGIPARTCGGAFCLPLHPLQQIEITVQGNNPNKKLCRVLHAACAKKVQPTRYISAPQNAPPVVSSNSARHGKNNESKIRISQQRVPQTVQTE